MRLTDLLARSAALANEPPATGRDPQFDALEILGLTADSRLVRPGFLFAALPGSRADGRDYIAAAAEKGAVAVLAPRGTTLPEGGPALPLLADANPRRRLALFAAAFAGRAPKTLVCVTGTSGKTSVAHFTRGLWALCGRRAASLGTLGLVPPDALDEAPPALTTPDPVALMRALAGLAVAGFEHVALEASSHGLDQYRLDGLRPAAAAFTNLSHEHLDYHGTEEAYFAAKRRLFAELLPEGATAVIAADAAQAGDLIALAGRRKQRLITFGRDPQAHLRLLERRPTADGQDLVLSLFGRRYELHLPLLGEFQALNVLAALGLVLGSGLALTDALAALPRLGGVPGRLEFAADTPAGGRVYVDYAHKPAALEAVLQTLRPHTPGRLWVVFGCGGDRDRAKRPLMGEIAGRLADQVVVTDDNPRSEEPAAIRRAIVAACPWALEIGERRAAIAVAMLGLKADDILVVAGKGHEAGQIVGDRVLPFDDRLVAQQVAAELRRRAA